MKFDDIISIDRYMLVGVYDDDELKEFKAFEIYEISPENLKRLRNELPLESANFENRLKALNQDYQDKANSYYYELSEKYSDKLSAKNSKWFQSRRKITIDELEKLNDNSKTTGKKAKKSDTKEVMGNTYEN